MSFFEGAGVKGLAPSVAKLLHEEAWDRYLLDCALLDQGKVNQLGWQVLPILEEITETEAKRLASWASWSGVEEVLAVTTNPKHALEGYSVEMTVLGFLQVNAMCLLRSILLTDKGHRFVLLHEGDYFHLICGPPSLLEVVAPEGVEDACARFRKGVREWGWGAGSKKTLARAAELFAPQEPLKDSSKP